MDDTMLGRTRRPIRQRLARCSAPWIWRSRLTWFSSSNFMDQDCEGIWNAIGCSVPDSLESHLSRCGQPCSWFSRTHLRAGLQRRIVVVAQDRLRVAGEGILAPKGHALKN